MFLLGFIPFWLFGAALLISIGVAVATKIIPFKQALIAYWIAVAMIVLSTFLVGAKSVDNIWKQRAKDLEEQVLKLQAQAAEVNTEIVKEVVTKTQVVKVKGNDIVKYIDREVVKSDGGCVIPQAFVDAHNRAAEAPK